MRAITCSHCPDVFRRGGSSRVMRGVLFHFCRWCWGHDRRGCEQQMDAVTR